MGFIGGWFFYVTRYLLDGDIFGTRY